jgi:hypothetical protein
MAVGFPTKANWVAGDVLTASALDDLAGTVNLLQYSQQVAGKNALINGGFDVWQRGTSSTTTSGYLTADRWYCYSGGAVTWSQESTVIPSGSRYCMKILSGASIQPILYQAIETLNAVYYAGSSITLSAQVQASVSTVFNIDIQYSTSVDVGPTGSWTTITATSGGTATAVSGSFTRLSGVFAIPLTAKSLMVRIYPATIATGVSLYVGQVQMELGTSPSPFFRNASTLQGELAACQRYYYRNTSESTGNYLALGFTGTTTTGQFMMPLPVTMRVAPAALEYANCAIIDGVTQSSITALVVNWTSKNYINIYTTGSTGLTAFRPSLICANGSVAYIGFSAEL